MHVCIWTHASFMCMCRCTHVHLCICIHIYKYVFTYICLHACVLSHFRSVQLFCDPMGCSLPLSSIHGISQQEYWSGLSFPPRGDLPDLGIKPTSPVAPALQAYSLPQSHQGSPLHAYVYINRGCLYLTQIKCLFGVLIYFLYVSRPERACFQSCVPKDSMEFMNT